MLHVFLKNQRVDSTIILQTNIFVKESFCLCKKVRTEGRKKIPEEFAKNSPEQRKI